ADRLPAPRAQLKQQRAFRAADFHDGALARGDVSLDGVDPALDAAVAFEQLLALPQGRVVFALLTLLPVAVVAVELFDAVGLEALGGEVRPAAGANAVLGRVGTRRLAAPATPATVRRLEPGLVDGLQDGVHNTSE